MKTSAPASDLAFQREIQITGNDIEASITITNSSSGVPENALWSASTALKIGRKILKKMSKLFSRKHDNIPTHPPAASSSSPSSSTAPSFGASGLTSQAEVVSPSCWSWLLEIRNSTYNLMKKVTEAILSSTDHQVFRVIKRVELAKHMLALSVPMVITFVTLAITSHVFKRLITVLISVAAALIMNGMLLSETYRRLASFLETIGIVLLLSAFFAFGFHILPGILGLIPLVCFLASLTPIAIAFCCRNDN